MLMPMIGHWELLPCYSDLYLAMSFKLFKLRWKLK